MPNIYWMYRNKLENASSITESSGTSDTNYGTANIKDFDLHTSFRSNSGEGTKSTLLFNFGSSVYIDSAIAVHTLPSVGTLVLKSYTNNPKERVSNGNMEADSGALTGWSQGVQSGGTATLGSSTVDPYRGSYSLLSTIVDGSDNITKLQLYNNPANIEVVKDGRYQIFFCIKSCSS